MSVALCWVLAPLSVFGNATSNGLLADLPSDLPSLEGRLAAEPACVPVLLRAALEYHNRAAFEGPESDRMLQQSRRCLDTLLGLDPGHTFARALLGSAIIISAREPIWPGTKIRRVKEGLEVMDAAIARNPEDADARFTRASNNLFLPDFFKRRQVVESDFQWLQERADRGEFAEDFRQYVFLYHGFAQQRWGHRARARSLWEAGLRIAPESRVAAEIREAQSGTSELAQAAEK